MEKEEKKAVADEKKEERKIPYVGCVRVGNFKVWKSRVRERKSDVIHISDMDGTWGVKIPQNYLSFKVIESCYKDGEEDYLMTMFANMNFVSAIANGFYQRGVAMVGHAYLRPELLQEGYAPQKGPSHADMMDEVKRTCEGFLKWYAGTLKTDKANASSGGAQADVNDEVADMAGEILSHED